MTIPTTICAPFAVIGLQDSWLEELCLVGNFSCNLCAQKIFQCNVIEWSQLKVHKPVLFQAAMCWTAVVFPRVPAPVAGRWARTEQDVDQGDPGEETMSFQPLKPSYTNK